ncbi:MAG: bifunctional DNA primase/polymerase [Chthoniobacterales bacterium]
MSSLIIPDNINELSRWDQVSLFHRHGDTIVVLDPPSQGKNGKKTLEKKKKTTTTKRLSDFELFQFFGNGAHLNVGVIPKDGEIIVDLDGKDKDRAYADRFLDNTPALAGVPRVQTAGGYHLRFKCEDLPSSVRQAGYMVQTEIAPGVNFEVFAGENYVVVPPSVHEKDIPYTWTVKGEVPAWSWEQISTAFNLPEQQEPAESGPDEQEAEWAPN